MNTNIVIDITSDEWDQAAHLITLLAGITTSDSLLVNLRAEGGRRRWYVADESVGAFVEAGSDDREFSVYLPFHACWHGARVANVYGSAQVRLDHDSCSVGNDSEVLLWPYAAPSRQLVAQFHNPDPDARVFSADVAELRRLVTSSLDWREDSEMRNVVPVGIMCIGDTVQIRQFRESPKFLVASFVSDSLSGEEQVSAEFDANKLAAALRIFPDGENVTVHFPTREDERLVISGASCTASVRQLATPLQVARRVVENVLEEWDNELTTIRDADGDYVLTRHGHRIYGRIVGDDNPFIFQIFCVAINDIEPTPDLYEEINDINTHIQFLRAFVVERQLIFEADVLVEEFNSVEIDVIVSRLRNFAGNVAPMVHAVHGGLLHTPQELQRWSDYARTIVTAQVTPTQMVALNGKDAVDEWPFPGPVHVVTGWNPQGIARRGDDINRMIAADVLAEGGQFVLGEGSSLDGNHKEHSLVVWGITREFAAELGRRASQDAIFEIDDMAVRIVACDGDRVEKRGRVDDLTNPESSD